MFEKLRDLEKHYFFILNKFSFNVLISRKYCSEETKKLLRSWFRSKKSQTLRFLGNQPLQLDFEIKRLLNYLKHVRNCLEKYENTQKIRFWSKKSKQLDFATRFCEQINIEWYCSELYKKPLRRVDAEAKIRTSCEASSSNICSSSFRPNLYLVDWNLADMAQKSIRKVNSEWRSPETQIGLEQARTHGGEGVVSWVKILLNARGEGGIEWD